MATKQEIDKAAEFTSSIAPGQEISALLFVRWLREMAIVWEHAIATSPMEFEERQPLHEWINELGDVI